MTRLTEELTATTTARIQSVAKEIIIIIICPGYDVTSGCGVLTWDNEVTLRCNYLQVTLEQGVVPVSSPRGHEIPSWHPAGDSLSHG